MQYKTLLRRSATVYFISIALLACGQGESVVPHELGEPAERESLIPSPNAPESLTPENHYKGIDISHHSGDIDWPGVLDSGQDFAFLKATEGVDLVDPAFAAHWRAAKEAAILRGAYHFYVTEDDPEEQARLFIDNVTLEPGDLAPVVDIELLGQNTAPGLPGRLKTWLFLIEEHYGIKPIIYTSPNFWDKHLTDEFGDYPLWVAEYQVDTPRLPKGWKTWHLWQWQDDATVPGIEKDADLSRANRLGPDLSKLIIPVYE